MRLLLIAAMVGGMPTADYNAKIVKFCESNVGKKVGNGQCWSLLRQASVVSGVRVPGVNRSVLDFGRPIKVKSIKPGDYCLMKNVKIVIRKANSTTTIATPKGVDHFAIVRTVKPLSFYSQNQNNDGIVHIMDGLENATVEGDFRYWRPIP